MLQRSTWRTQATAKGRKSRLQADRRHRGILLSLQISVGFTELLEVEGVQAEFTGLKPTKLLRLMGYLVHAIGLARAHGDLRD
ncbi:hypothetical protein WJX74_003715 [Apatococcus lobatus]|uniref:Uncharacterized protein n=1 Tax=Apatococcus lobatus TaxID=904363 RepID=A0AAW1Q9W5_9CHLO